MKDWGRVSLLLAVGVFLGAGCGGRTSALGDGYGPVGSGADGSGADGSGADGNGGSGTQPRAGATSSGGRPVQGGAPSYAGTIGIGGTGYPAGASYGGYPSGGAYAFGGAYPGGGAFPIAGTGFGGNPNQPGGTCCEAQMGPSCRPAAVAKCVCNAAPYCCDKQWDAGCASLVERLGCGYCDRFDCDTCLNQSCSFELSQCYQEFGCLSILTCMQTNSCEPFQCYTDGQCKAVIDQWGGPGGYSMSLLLTAYSCAIQSGCPCN